MAEPKKYNNFSPELKSLLPKLKKGEKVRFQLERVHYDKITKKLVCPKSVTLAKVDRIYDPWAIKTGKGAVAKYEGDYVDIAVVVRESPASQTSLRDTITDFGTIKFTNTFAGIIEIHGGNRSDEKMLPYLFFSNRNKSNIGKEYFIKADGKPIFKLLEPEKTATTDLTAELRIDKALAMITEMDDDTLNTAAAGLMPNKHQKLTKDQKILALRALAKNNATKILDLSSDVSVQTTALIEEFLKAKLICISVPKGEVQWFDSKERLCIIKPTQTAHNSLKRYFLTPEGNEVLKLLENLLATSKASKKDKTEKVIV